ncbi:TPA: hypothetical protein N0F65_007848 [Lagenidium giganteum]|uniref:RNase H type-1 domain-containing protein n=1 Tax=Lagenidium giganteum TaxID=4803 RepID=A0AAV2YHD9_9STRA|nr:TPA: hypothetical protein N0F65_007848 [Lagenidium giganteum]
MQIRRHEAEGISVAEPCAVQALKTSWAAGQLRVSELVTNDSVLWSLYRHLNTAVGATDQEPIGPLTDRDLWILFFDGGSRGNPGLSGCGCVLLHQPAHTSTNNRAEYDGLLLGLIEARRRHILRLHMVGESLLVITQMQARRPPRNPHLRTKYARARNLADLVHIESWNHHLRAQNKMADATANLAMDTSTSAAHVRPFL